VLKGPLFAAIASVLLLLPVGCSFHRGMSADQVAAYFERTTNGNMLNVVCTSKDTDTNGWKYSCSYTDPHDGSRMKVGANIAQNAPGGPAPVGSGSVPINDPLPPNQ
jgi:hypothetical protein